MKKEIILITGANGLISNALAEKLSPNYEIRFLSRNPKKNNEFYWNIAQNQIDENALENISHIIHLAGATISKRWTKSYKAEIISSRVDSAKLLLLALKKRNQQIKSFITASATGYYGAVTSSKIFAEYDTNGTDFLSDVVWQWEQIADEFAEEGVATRVVKLRTGLVLSEKGGALPKMIFSMKFGVGIILGAGNQYVPYISLDDLCRMYAFAVTNETLHGVFNACDDNYLNYKQLLKKVAPQKPLFYLKIPAFLIRLVMGESAVIVLKGSRVSPKKIKQAGLEITKN